MITSAYIHIPFCQQICHYCDFTKFFYNEDLANQYLDALDKEIETEVGKKRQYMKTIFVGGGTPTALNYHQLEQLLQTISEAFDVENCEEYTFNDYMDCISSGLEKLNSKIRRVIDGIKILKIKGE